MARITVRNRIIHLGHFKTIAEARIARLLAEKEYLGEFHTWDEIRDGTLPLGDGFINIFVRENRLFLLSLANELIEITDVKQIQTVPVTADGQVIQ